MTNNNLKPIISTARARELGRKGGKVKSVAKSNAARMREIRKKSQLNESDIEWLHMQINDKKASAFDCLVHIQLLLELAFESGTTKDKFKAVKSQMEWHKMWHGSKK